MSKNRKRLVFISSPGGKTVKWIKKSRSSCPEVFCKKVVLNKFAKFTGKHLYWRLYKKSYRSQGCITIYWNNFFAYQRLILLYHFHQKISKQKMAVFKTNRCRHWRCSIKKLFLKISQNLQKNTCVRVSFLINFIKNFLLQGNQVFAYHDYIFLPLISELSLRKVSITPRTIRHHRF